MQFSGTSTTAGNASRRSPRMLEPLEPRLLLAAQLVKDIHADGASDPQNLVELNGAIYFTAEDGVHGRELWRTDRLSGRTRLVKDIKPGPGGSSPAGLVVLDGALLFSAHDGAHGFELWRSDGTEAGTALVSDVRRGPHGSRPAQLTVAGDALYFSAHDGASGRELWRSDGTARGTSRVADIHRGARSSSPLSLTNVNGSLYFTAIDSAALRYELWKSDGTTAGTVKLPGAYPTEGSALAELSGRLFFAGSSPTDDESGVELWRTDGSRAGTAMVKDVWPGGTGPICDDSSTDVHCFPGSTYSSSPEDFTVVNGTVFFTAANEYGRALWRSDGSDAGTVFLKNGTPDAYSLVRASWANVNGTLYFAAFEAGSSTELWKTDGTPQGTVLVRDIAPGEAHSFPGELTVANGLMYFTADDGVHGRELWRSDGTAAGTVRMADVAPGSRGSDPRDLTVVNGNVFFTADDGTRGRELWVLPFARLGDNGALLVDGTDGPDVISLAVRDSALRVRLNDQLLKFPAADVRHVEVQSLAGNDVVDGSGLSVPMYVNAGLGDDVVSTGAGDDTLNGAAGRDTLRGGGGDDRLSGGKGKDRLLGGAGDDVFFARDLVRDLLDGGDGDDRAQVDDPLDGASAVERILA